MAKLWAISDLHVSFAENRQLLERLSDHGDDWLIVAGDVGETLEHLEFAWRLLSNRFAKTLWVPGNHELWTSTDRPDLRGVQKYEALVQLCREYQVLTPEDPVVLWHSGERELAIVLLFGLYDYSYCPDEVGASRAVAWAREAGIRCADESLLQTTPYSNIVEWCHDRVHISEARLAAAAATHPTVIVNHFPLRSDLVRIPAIPRFTPWCGTTRSENWHVRYRAEVVVSGHLHVRATDWRDSVRFEEVSLGYPRQWRDASVADEYLRQILPGPESGPVHGGGPYWRRTP